MKLATHATRTGDIRVDYLDLDFAHEDLGAAHAGGPLDATESIPSGSTANVGCRIFSDHIVPVATCEFRWDV